MRIMGIDYGDARIGVALSDPLGITAQTFEVIHRNVVRDVLGRIVEIIKEQEVTRIVVGLPRNMNGTLGERVEKTNFFADQLKERTGLPIAFMDERLSTVSAHKLLIAGDVRRDKRKQVVDKVAAALILQSYLDKLGRE